MDIRRSVPARQIPIFLLCYLTDFRCEAFAFKTAGVLAIGRVS